MPQCTRKHKWEKQNSEYVKLMTNVERMILSKSLYWLIIVSNEWKRALRSWGTWAFSGFQYWCSFQQHWCFYLEIPAKESFLSQVSRINTKLFKIRAACAISSLERGIIVQNWRSTLFPKPKGRYIVMVWNMVFGFWLQ